MKKFTMLLLMAFGAVGFAQQTTLKENGKSNPIYHNQQRSKTVVIPEGQRNAETEIINLGKNKPYFGNEGQAKSNAQNPLGQKAENAEMNKLGENIPVYYNKEQNKSKSVGTESEVSATHSDASNKKSARSESERAMHHSITAGDTNKVTQLEKSIFGTTSSSAEEEILADEMYRASRPSGFGVSTVRTGDSPEADFTPTAGATETFTPAVGDHFFDPGGPGGSSNGGDPGNYPNCGCATQTTLAGVGEIDFKFFSVFATFDYLRIYDGTDATGTKLYDNGAGGANAGDITLADMIASHGSSTFTAASGNFFFYFHASTVVDYGGWDVEITGLGGGGGGGSFPAPYCGVNFGTVEPMTLLEVAGISNRSSEVVNGSPAHEDFTAIVGNMEEGQSYPIALEGNTAGNWTASFTVFIDWNQDGILDNASERYQIGTIVNSTGTDGKQATGTIVVPAGVAEGPTRMRVIKQFNSPYAADSCTGTSWGQAEDYTINVTAAGGGGGGGVACSQDHPFGIDAAGGSGSSVDSDYKTAADVTVVAGQNFTIDTIEATFLTFAPLDAPITANVVYYADAAGLPGAIIGSETVVPTILSSAPWANPVAFQFMTSMAVTPFTFTGDASSDTTYWIEVSMGTATAQGTVFWEYTDDIPVEGYGYAKYDGTLGTWEIEEPSEEVIYTFSGECEAIGGGGGGGVCGNPVLEVNQDVDDTCMAFMAPGIAQSYIPLEAEAAGAGIKFRDPSTGLNVTLSLWDNLPNAGGVMLTSGTADTDGTNWVDVLYDDVVNVTVGNTYYIVVNGDNALPCLSGSTNNPYPGGMTYANDYSPFPNFDYTFRTFSCDSGGGGGGGVACSQDNPENNFENGHTTSKNGTQVIATDITVPADTDFSLDKMTVHIWMSPGATLTSADITFYDNGSDLPGAVRNTYPAVVPVSQTVIGNNFGFDISEVVFEIAPEMLPGTAGATTTYWTSLYVDVSANGNGYISSTSVSTVGFQSAFSSDSGATWSVNTGWDTVYVFEGVCEAIGGGGTGGPCSASAPSNAFENGKSFTQNLGRIVAADITIAADEDMMLETINLTAFVGAVGSGVNADFLDVYIYADSGTGSPGALLNSQLGVVPASQTVIGNNFGYDAWSIDLDIADFNLVGQTGVTTTYWIGLSLEPTDGTNTFWEFSSSAVNGYGLAYDEGTGFIIEPTNEVVYTFSGTCTSTGGGGGGDPCGITGPSNGMEDGKSFTKNLGRIVANDLPIAAGEDMLLETITFSAFIGDAGSGVNASNVDVFIYENNAGAPGALVTSQTSVVPASQTVTGSNFGYDLWEVVLDITNVNLPGQVGATTTYWIGLSLEPTDGSNTFWEYSSAGVIGYGLGYNDGGGYVMESGNEGVYTFAGTCSPTDTTPINDQCSGAIAISCGESIFGTTVDATIDSGAPVCGPDITSPGVWYTLDDTSGMAGEITFSLCDGSTTFDTKLSIYTGDCSALVCVAGNDDSCGLQSSVTVPSNGNTKFYILVHSFGGETGTFTLDATCTPTPPPNDKIANSIYVTPLGFPYTDPSVAMPAATTEAGNPQGCDLTGANGVWYHFTSAGDGIAEASITTPGGASSVTFYTAPSLNAVETDLVLVDQNTNQCVPGTSASVYTLAGQIYYVFVLNNGAVTNIVIDGTNLGVANNTIEGFSYYPNPTNGVLNLNSKDNIEMVTIYNLLGQAVLTNNVGATSATLDISRLSVGTYMMKATVNGQVGVYKIVKK